MFRMGGGSGGTPASPLRVVGRTVKRVGVSREPFSSGTSSDASSVQQTSPLALESKSSLSHVSFSSLASSYTKIPVIDTSGLPCGHFCSSEFDESEWVAVDGAEEWGRNGFSGGHAFGQVPSEDEVQDAVFSLQQVFRADSNGKVSSDGSEQDWVEPSMSPYKSGLLLPHGADSVYHAFYLLQTDPSIQRTVKSLSSDKAVWDAVLNNEVVRELRDSYSIGEKKVPESADGTSKNDSPSAMNIIMWIFNTAKTKFTEMIERVTMVVYELFQPQDKSAVDSTSHSLFDEKIRTCFMLSVMVMLVVVVSRTLRA